MREALLVVAALVSFVAVLALLVARHRRRPRALPPPQEPATPRALPEPEREPDRALVLRPARRSGLTRHPIVLAHGLFGFDALGVSRARCHYFRGVPERLRDLGAELHLLRVAPMSSVAVRAQQLADQIRRLSADRVTVIAHSMGGLDARHAISSLGLADRVACLVTIGTPHRGTPIADFLDRMLDLPAIRELTTLRMEAYNAIVLDAPDVQYASIVGAAREVTPLLAPTHRFLAEHAGANDGLVPASSQRWGEVLLDVDVDHWGQIGWSRRFDAASFYAELAVTLADRGF